LVHQIWQGDETYADLAAARTLEDALRNLPAVIASGPESQALPAKELVQAPQATPFRTTRTSPCRCMDAGTGGSNGEWRPVMSTPFPHDPDDPTGPFPDPDVDPDSVPIDPDGVPKPDREPDFDPNPDRPGRPDTDPLG
jgi:hypothetical protein